MDEREAKANALGRAVAETVCNTAVEIDPRSARRQSSCVNLYLSKLSAKQSEHCETLACDTFPNDDIMQIMIYAFPAIKNILQAPREKMYRQPEMVAQHRVRGFSRKSITWLSKRPGKTVREKVVSSPRILSEKKLFSADTPENRALAYLIRHLYDALCPRIKRVSSYNCDEEQPCAMKEWLCGFERLFRQFRHSHLNDIPARMPDMANNVLLSDKNYKKIWKAVSLYRSWCSRSAPTPSETIEGFTYSVAANAASDFFIEYQTELIDSKKPWKEIFPAELLFTDNAGDRRLLRVSINSTGTAVILETAPLRKESDSLLSVSRIDRKYTFEMEAAGEFKDDLIGRPILVRIGGYVLHAFGDHLGVQKTVEAICTYFEEDFGLAKREEFPQPIGINQQITADFTSFDVCARAGDTSLPKYSVKELGAIPAANCVYYLQQHMSSLHNLPEPEYEGSCNSLLEYYSRVAGDNGFTYLVPDDCDEFEQKSLRKQIGAYFSEKSSFPVWRSVAAADYIKSEKQVYVRQYIVLDPTGGTCSKTVIKVRPDGYLERFPSVTLSGCESICEDYFAEAYLRGYLSRHLPDKKFDNEDIRDILAMGQIHKLCSGMLSEALVYLKTEDGDVECVVIGQDGKLINELMKNAEDCLKSISANPAKDSGMDTATILICSNNVMRKSLDWLIKKNSIITCSAEQLLESAGKLAERYHKGEKTWFEHLPKLEFIVPKGGRYRKIKLIDSNQNTVDAAQQESRITVEETLVLPADGKKRVYEFPLMKKELGRNSRIYARITDGSFPLAKDLSVSMEIVYRYGYEDTYELIFKPIGDYKPFTSVTAEWVDKINAQKEDASIEVPVPAVSEADVNKAIARYQDEMEYTIKQLRYLRENRDNYRIEPLQDKVEDLFYAMRPMIRYTMIQDNEEINTEMERFDEKILPQYMKILTDPESFTTNTEIRSNRKVLNTMLYSLALFAGVFICSSDESVEKLFSEDFFNSSLIENLKGTDPKSYKFVCSYVFQYYLMYCEEESVWDSYIEFFSRTDDDVKKAIVRSMSVMFWQNPQTLYRIHKDYPKVLEWVCEYCENYVITNSNSKIKDDYRLKPMRDIMETILAILRLRTERGFAWMTTGGKQALILAEAVKLYDMRLYEAGELTIKIQNKTYETTFCEEFDRIKRVKLNLSRSEALENMCELCYVLVVYLTGDEGSDTIRILDFDDE